MGGCQSGNSLVKDLQLDKLVNRLMQANTAVAVEYIDNYIQQLSDVKQYHEVRARINNVNQQVHHANQVRTQSNDEANEQPTEQVNEQKMQ